MLDDLAAQVEAAQQEEGAAAAALEEVNNRKPPENQGLDTATKRSINLMILSFAQQLYLHFSDDDLAKLAKEASDKSVGAINYGNREDCNELLTRVQRRLEAMEKSADFAGVLQRRAKMLGENAAFREEGDAVPTAASVATVYNIDGNGLVHKSEANILGENYWGISKILSR